MSAKWSRPTKRYGLSFNAGPGGEHQMDICGAARHITRAHLLELAAKGGIKLRLATASVERMLEQVGPFARRLRDQPIRRTTIRAILETVDANAARLGVAGTT